MAKLNDLYLKYANEIGPVLEEDGYFQYLYETLEGGQNVMDQQSVVLHKTVDEEWIKVIEDNLDALFKVTAEPRRHIKTTEELVPVDLAKKITGDSVRHLSQNTQFIVSNEEGAISPTKVLNVTVEETYDLYENRFLYHLIQRLITFIDKRTDVIFWATGDERFSTLKFTSEFEDENEKIEYEISMKVSDKTEMNAEDKNHMEIFERIDRLRRQIMSLRRSYFCEVMAGCAKVRSPIQRTNLLTKDRHYRKCLDLWHFLERYESIGYSIDEEKRALQFDEEYIFQFYTNVIANYTTFKSLMDPDKRNIAEDTYKVKKKVHRRPKFMKSIKEEFADSPNLEDVEVRKIFVDYVTLAQLEAEEKEKKAIEAQHAAEEKQHEAEVKQAQAEEKQAEAEAKQAQAEEKQALAEEKQAQAEQKQADAEAFAVQTEKNCNEKIQLAQEEADAKVDAAQKEADNKVAEAQNDAIAKIDAAQKEADNKVAEAQKEADEKVDAAWAEARKDADTKIGAAQEEADAKVVAARKDAELQISFAKKDAASQIDAAQKDADAKVESALSAAEEKVKAAKLRADDALNEKKEALTARDASEKKAAESDAHAIKAFEDRDAAIKAKEMAEAMMAHAELDKAQAFEQAEESIRKAREESQKAAELMMQAQEMLEKAKQIEEAAMLVKVESEMAGKKAEKEALKMLTKMKDLTLPQYLALRKEIKMKETK